MSEQYAHDIFISFSFADQDVAEEIVNTLTSKYGFSCWICTRDIEGGRRYKALIPQAIDDARAVVFIQSANALASREIPKEIGMAFDADKTIIPFKLDQAQPQGDLRYDLYGVEYIDATVPTKEQRIYELAKAISKAIDKPLPTDSSSALGEKLVSTPSVIPKNIFCGRDGVLEEISQKYADGERVIFIQGIGGIGKTEIVKQYAKHNKDKYDTIVYATFGGSLVDLFNAEEPFELEPALPRLVLSDGTQEDDFTYFKRKLQKIQKLSDERTLIIIDNFDVEDDVALPELLKGKYHLLLTTRCDYSRLYPAVKVGPIDSIENLVDVFMQNYQGYEVERDDPDLVALIELVNRHTYTIELLAQHMENSGQTAGEMLEALRKEGILSLNEDVRQIGNKTQVAYENLLKMFKVFALNEEEQRVLRLLSLMPLGGVSVRDFKFWAELTSLKILNDLESRSWIMRNTGGVALHPIVREVIRHELPVTKENTNAFLQKFTETILETKTWRYPMSVKEIYAAIAAELLKVFDTIDENTLSLYQKTETLFSFSVRPKTAVELAIRLYEYQCRTAGKESYPAGYAAFKTGWAYKFNLQLENALENAKLWLERGDEILCNLQLSTAAENANYGQLLGNLSRICILMSEEEYDKEKLLLAKKYAQQSVEVSAAWLVPGDPQYPKLAGAYMQLADACIALEEYEQAMQLLDDAYDILFPLFGENDPDTLHALARKATVLYHTGRHSEALALAQSTADGYGHFYGEVHDERYEQLLIVLKSHIALNNMDKAKELQAYALGIGEKIFTHNSKQLQALKALL